MIANGGSDTVSKMLRYAPTAVPESVALVRVPGRSPWRPYALRYTMESAEADSDESQTATFTSREIPVAVAWNYDFVLGVLSLLVGLGVGALLAAAVGRGYAFIGVALALLGVALVARAGFRPTRPSLRSLAEMIIYAMDEATPGVHSAALSMRSEADAKRALRRLAKQDQLRPGLLGGSTMRQRQSWMQSWQKTEEALPHMLSDLTHVQREIVELRWLDQAKTYDQLWRGQRIAHYSMRAPIIAAAATVPVLASLNVAKLATALLGLVVAVLTGLDTFFQFGLRWQQRRRAAIAITTEGWEYIGLSGRRYLGKSHAEALPIFLGQLETLSERLSLQYLDIFSETARRPGADDDSDADAGKTARTGRTAHPTSKS